MDHSIKKNMTLGIFIAVLGAIIGGVVWLLLYVMDLGIDFLWHQVPARLGTWSFYPLVVCTVGGVLVGCLQKRYGPCPQELSTVMGEIKAGKRQPYNHLPALAICALVPLIFGGSLGPEAGLTGVIAGLCYWLSDKLKDTYEEVDDLVEMGIAATLGTIFRAPLFGFVNEVEDAAGEKKIPKNSKIVLYFLAILGGFATYSLLSATFGGGMGMGRFSQVQMDTLEWVAMVPLGFLGALCGIAFHGFGRLTQIILKPMDQKPILKGIVGGVVLGGVAMVLPFTMWAGESQMETMMDLWTSLPVWMLFATGIVKLWMTNFCIGSGWRGGNIFPVIFSGVCVGYGCAALFPGLDPVFCVAVVTAGVAGSVMGKPLAVIMLLMIMFPVTAMVPMCVGAFMAAAIPVPNRFKTI